MKKPDFPKAGASVGKAQREFKQIAREMRESRSSDLGMNRRSRVPNKDFKRRAYELISYYVVHGWHHVFALVLSELDRIPKTSIQPAENPFFWGLAALCGEEDIFSMNQLRRIAKGMQCAYESGVPANQVISFLGGLAK